MCSYELRKRFAGYLERFEKLDAMEIEELRRTPVEVKLQQLWSGMTSAELFESAEEREAGVAAVRERWRRVREAFVVERARTEGARNGPRGSD